MNGRPLQGLERNRPRRRQHGAALVIGLILLLVLTILAVSGVMSSTLELRMVGNQQQQERAFQAAEVAIEQALADATLSMTPQVQPRINVPDSTDEYDYRIAYAGGTDAPPGFSMGESGFHSHHYVITANGYSAAGAESTHTQGFYVVGP